MKSTLLPLLALTVALTLVGCGGQSTENRSSTSKPSATVTESKLPDGRYNVQNVTYEDAGGSYEIFLLNPPAGSKPIFTSKSVQMAQIDDAGVKAGTKTYLEIKGGTPSLYLLPDFKVAYTHNVTEERKDPSTGQAQTVVVRQESSFWTPFVASMAGAAIGNALFAPRYYVPPMYSPGGMMTGYGGSGLTRDSAYQGYQQRYGSAPPATRLSRSGSFGSTSGRTSTNSNGLRSTGSGAGSSRLGTSSDSSSSQYRRNSSGSSSRSFGTSRGRRR